ncbi:MAG: hypothetical protein H0U27_12270 [Nitrosopumilus sp.]|nr:hypothetical protein [Nitrosopumilus sp.]
MKLDYNAHFAQNICSNDGYATDETLINFPNLQTLAIYNTPEVSAYGIKSLVKLTDLTIHDEGYEIFKDDWIPHLTNLTSLNFSDTPPDQTKILNIKQTLTNLKNFNITKWRHIPLL